MRRGFSRLLITGPLLFTGLSACQSTRGPAGANQTADAETAVIQSEASDWFNAIAAKDLEKTLSFYAPDAQYLSAGRPAAATPQTRRALWLEDYQSPGFSSDEKTTKIEVAQSGELAYQCGTYVSNSQDAQGKIVTSTGKFLVVWKKQSSGKWKAIIDIDNADQ
jgi:ketosteroid isomerase-like protein